MWNSDKTRRSIKTELEYPSKGKYSKKNHPKHPKRSPPHQRNKTKHTQKTKQHKQLEKRTPKHHKKNTHVKPFRQRPRKTNTPGTNNPTEKKNTKTNISQKQKQQAKHRRPTKSLWSRLAGVLRRVEEMEEEELVERLLRSCFFFFGSKQLNSLGQKTCFSCFFIFFVGRRGTLAMSGLKPESLFVSWGAKAVLFVVLLNLFCGVADFFCKSFEGIFQDLTFSQVSKCSAFHDMMLENNDHFLMILFRPGSIMIVPEVHFLQKAKTNLETGVVATRTWQKRRLSNNN